jgi:long-chain fatty acid transport protein
MKQIVKRSLLAASVAAAIGAMGSAHATNGYELIGIGSYQMGMAGAVVSAPGSAMTAITNPAGLTEITPQADFSMEAFMPERNINFNATGGGKSKSNTDMYGIPALGWSAPTSDGSNVYFGGGMYGTSGMGVDYPQTLYGPNPSAMGGGTNYFRGYSNLSLWQMAPALAWKVNNKLSLGAALDIGYMSASFQQQIYNSGMGVINGVNMSRSASAFALGATLGMLYKINPMWTVGASYTSEQTYKLKYNLASGDIVAGGSSYPGGQYTLTMKTPQMAAIGVTMHATPALSISGQVKYIGWKDVMDNLSITGPKDYSGFMPKWKDQTVYAIAANYMVTPALQVRVGYNYGKSPIEGHAIGYNMILPAVVESHYTAGFDYQLNNHWKLGGALMYAPKKTYTAPMTTSSSDPNKGQKIDLSETAVSFNIGYKF